MMLTSALRNLFAGSESYPDPKANRNFPGLRETVTSPQQKISCTLIHESDIYFEFRFSGWKVRSFIFEFGRVLMFKAIVPGILVFFFFFASCGSSDEGPAGTAAQPKGRPGSAAKEQVKTVRPPEEVAVDFIDAFRKKDLETLRSLSIFSVGAYFTEESNQLDNIFTESLMNSLKGWDGKIREVRYMKNPLTQKNDAVVYYSDTTPSGTPGKIAVLNLTCVQGPWLYGNIGFHEVDRKTFEGYSKENH